MHPPLDRPHPDCQPEIDQLRHCQETRSIFRVSACNELKFKLDQCFKEEKGPMLEEMNTGIESRRAEEEAQAAVSTGKNVTFAQFLENDKAYKIEMEEIKKKKPSSWF